MLSADRTQSFNIHTIILKFMYLFQLLLLMWHYLYLTVLARCSLLRLLNILKPCRSQSYVLYCLYCLIFYVFRRFFPSPSITFHLSFKVKFVILLLCLYSLCVQDRTIFKSCSKHHFTGRVLLYYFLVFVFSTINTYGTV